MKMKKQIKQIRKKLTIKNKSTIMIIKKKGHKIKIKNQRLNRIKKNQYKWKEEMKQMLMRICH